MPLNGPSSYVPTTQEFLSHWANADGALGAGNEILFPDGMNLAGLQDLFDQLVAKRAELQDKLNDKEISRADVEIKKAALIGRLNDFNDRVRGFFSGSKWIEALPQAPGQRDAQGKFLDPIDDGASIWQKINSDPLNPSQIVLQGGYSQANFAADVAILKAAYATLGNAEQDLKLARSERNALQERIRPVLVTYRKVLPTFFAEGDPIVETLPRLTPLPGATPDPVPVQAEWDASVAQARITWEASDNPNLSQYQVRFVPGPDYNTDDEDIVAAVQPEEPLEVLTGAGLSVPGSTSSFKVYVILTTGNEKGSDPQAVTRPVALPP